MAALAGLVLRTLYRSGLPARLFWLADSTQTEKPYAKRVASVGWFHRTKRVAGRAQKLKGQCYVFAAHLYETVTEETQRWASVLVGALLYVKGRSMPKPVGQLAGHLRLPEGVRHVWVGDRGLISRPLLRAVGGLGQFVLGRVRCNQVVYFAPRRQARRGRKKAYGVKCRVDKLLRFTKRLRHQQIKLWVGGHERPVRVADAEVLLRGVWAGRPLEVRVIIVTVVGSQLKPWYLLTTDLELDVTEAVQAYGGRPPIEVNVDEIEELGLGHYMGRSGQGVRRWPLFLCVAHMMLKLMATEVIQVTLPKLHRSWYRNEHSVGQLRRRLIEYCRPRISRPMGMISNLQEIRKAA